MVEMFEIYDNVRIKSNGVIGTIVDISTVNGNTNYVVESSTENISVGYGGKWKLFDCGESDIEKFKSE